MVHDRGVHGLLALSGRPPREIPSHVAVAVAVAVACGAIAIDKLIRDKSLLPVPVYQLCYLHTSP